jgi:hypothetical protein
MPSSSRHEKVKRKGVVREVKIVQTVNRYGRDTERAEVVKTPRRESKNASLANPLSSSSSPIKYANPFSPFKRARLDSSDEGPISFNLEGSMSNKRQTLVRLFHLNRWLLLNSYRAKTISCGSSYNRKRVIWTSFLTLKYLQTLKNAILATLWKVNSGVRIVMGHIGGARNVSFNAIFTILSIGLNSGRTEALKKFRYATWATSSTLAMRVQATVAPMKRDGLRMTEG